MKLRIKKSRLYRIILIISAALFMAGIAFGVVFSSVFLKSSYNEAETSYIKMNVNEFSFDPKIIEVVQGTKVIIDIVNVTTSDPEVFRQHTFTMGPPYNIHEVLEVGKTYRIEFIADKAGEFSFGCAVFCGTGHAAMKGKLIVKPKSEAEKIQEKDFLDIEEISSTLKILAEEEALPDSPEWGIDDFKYLMAVIQTEYPGGAIKIINTKTLSDLGDIKNVGNRVHVVEIPPGKRWIYSISRDGIVSKIDLFSMRVTRQIKVGKDSRGLAMSEDGKYLAAGNYNPNSLVILDSETLRPLSVIEATGINPDGMSVRSRIANVFGIDSQRLFAVNLKEAGQTWLIEQKPPFRIVRAFSAGRLLHEINALTEDERFIAVTSQEDNKYAVIDTLRMEKFKDINSSKTPHPGQGTLDTENNLWYGNSIKSANITLIDTENMSLKGYVWPGGINASSGGGLFSSPVPPLKNVKYIVFDIIFGEHKGTLFFVDRKKAAAGELGAAPVVKTLGWKELGFETPGRITHPEYSYDGKYLVVSGWDFNKIVVLDAGALPEARVVKTFDAVTPTGIFPMWRTDAKYLG